MTWNKEIFNYKDVDYIENYNFGLDYVTIGGWLKIIKYKFLNSMNSKTPQAQSCRSRWVPQFEIKFIFIWVRMKKLWIIFVETIFGDTQHWTPASENWFLEMNIEFLFLLILEMGIQTCPRNRFTEKDVLRRLPL
jgi:hypothetical protein